MDDDDFEVVLERVLADYAADCDAAVLSRCRATISLYSRK
jgi:hypothetical protein